MSGVETQGLPTVRLEVRQAGRSVPYFVDQVDFLIGTVPGCDLRVPGADLPAVLCLLARHPAGVTLRRLAATQVLLHNGKTVSRAELADGDRLSLGAIDLFIHIEQAAAVATHQAKLAEPAEFVEPLDEEPPPSFDDERLQLQTEIADRERRLKTLQDERDRLSANFEAERQAHEREMSAVRAATPESLIGTDLLQRELAVDRREEDATRRQQELDAKNADIERQRQEIATVRQELADIRRQLHDRYQERRDRLSGLQAAVDKAARKVQEAKRDLEQSRLALGDDQAAFERRKLEIETQAQEFAQREFELEDRQRVINDSQQEIKEAIATKLADVAVREERLADQRKTLELRERQYEADVVRLDRQRGDLDQRERDFTERNQSLVAREQQLLSDSAELEQQAHDIDRMRTELEDESARLERQKVDQDGLESQLQQRSASLEGQQSALAGLRSRVERMREEHRQQEITFEEQRQAVQSLADKTTEERVEIEKQQGELAEQMALMLHERQELEQRQAVLADAVAKLREAQDRIGTEEQRIRDRTVELESQSAAAVEKNALVQGRLDQLAEAQARLDAERQTLRERTLALTQAEQAREALQEQLRRRGDELAQRHQQLADRIAQLQEKESRLEAARVEHETTVQSRHDELETKGRDVVQQEAEVVRRKQELGELEELQRRQVAELAERGRALAEQERALAEQQATNQELWRSQQEQLTAERQELETLRREGQELLLELPDIELRAGTSLDRLSHAREQLRDHLGELNAYVRQAQDDLEATRRRIQHDQAALDRKEQDLRRLHDEHRLALVAFRQQLIDWQGQIAELQRLLGRGEKGLENKHAKVEAQARKLDSAAQELAREAEVLEVQQRTVAEQRHEMDRHFVELRDWYRGKLRELAGIPLRLEAEPVPVAAALDDGPPPGDRDILSLTGPLDVGDRTLGNVLREHQLVDPDTLHALLVEARRQRRSLRQILLASGVVTVYQLALIETGNVGGLMLGPFRVVDRIRQTEHETIFRVYDPRRGQEAVLRHLSEEYAGDAVLPDEYRQRFKQLTLSDPHVAGTLESLDLSGRPAVVQEWLTGLPASDWPPLAAAPGVCYRLLTQAALGLLALHKNGLVHGRLSDQQLLLTSQGLLKLCGGGEPAWLHGNEEMLDPTTDLRALGQLVSGWCTPSGVRKGAKARPLPDRMVAILFKLQAEGDQGYTSARALLDDLDQAGNEIPPNPEAWDRLLRYVRDHAMPEVTLRQSA
jgi:chromosome segregation ATPase